MGLIQNFWMGLAIIVLATIIDLFVFFKLQKPYSQDRDIEDHVFLVVGARTTLGESIVRELAGRGAEVRVLCDSADNKENDEFLEGMRRDTRSNKIVKEECSLKLYASIYNFVSNWNENNDFILDSVVFCAFEDEQKARSHDECLDLVRVNFYSYILLFELLFSESIPLEMWPRFVFGSTRFAANRIEVREHLTKVTTWWQEKINRGPVDGMPSLILAEPDHHRCSLFEKLCSKSTMMESLFMRVFIQKDIKNLLFALLNPDIPNSQEVLLVGNHKWMRPVQPNAIQIRECGAYYEERLRLILWWQDNVFFEFSQNNSPFNTILWNPKIVCNDIIGKTDTRTIGSLPQQFSPDGDDDTLVSNSSSEQGSETQVRKSDEFSIDAKHFLFKRLNWKITFKRDK
ncbi:hypothetical protein PUMCH_001729 [Australozyma saopauloensis]|uniref:Uncharacterized protein n=1 Tax=Australozyma saopauloensis TaxID=291208 RepID=A0AAX4H7F3_9ASCO|nr:hypothetical protein PUMCH_001729 [[Candida] saopauloensis]